MNRRRFLTFLSIAPVVAGTAAMAASQPLASGGELKTGLFYRIGGQPSETVMPYSRMIDARGADKAAVERLERIQRNAARQMAEGRANTGVQRRI
jgi:hypothetical protein